MEALLPYFFKALLGLISIFGGATALETMLENFIMPKVPQWSRWIVTGLISFAFAFLGVIASGGTFGMGVAAGLAMWGRTVNVHNDPKTTSADWALPPPPDDALGLPGLAAVLAKPAAPAGDPPVI